MMTQATATAPQAQTAQQIRDAVREGVQAQREALRLQSEAQREAIRAQVEAQREAIKAQIEAQRAAREAGNVVVQVPPIPPIPPFNNNLGMPEGAVIISVAFFAACALSIIGLPIARAFGRRMDRRSMVTTADPDTSARLERIEQAVEAISIEVERISEGQRFTNQVMGEMRALPEGQAPAEPVRVREREGTPR